MSEQTLPIKRALISVADKRNLIPFARFLSQRGVQIVSTGGTSKTLQQQGIPVLAIEQLTGFPEILGGRVKTLHPKVHGALLAKRDDSHHAAQMKQQGIEPIDLVVVNLYPFSETIAKPGVTIEQAIEQIDIGGVTLIRAAAKNYLWVASVTSPDVYGALESEMDRQGGCLTLQTRQRLAWRLSAIPRSTIR